MGVWGADNFANDQALDYAHELVGQMIKQIETTIASDHGMEPDEPDSFRLMCNIDLIWLIGKHARLAMPDAKTVVDWKAKYLVAWDGYIDGLSPKPDYKKERRAVIVKTFNRLIALCRTR